MKKFFALILVALLTSSIASAYSLDYLTNYLVGYTGKGTWYSGRCVVYTNIFTSGWAPAITSNLMFAGAIKHVYTMGSTAACQNQGAAETLYYQSVYGPRYEVFGYNEFDYGGRTEDVSGFCPAIYSWSQCYYWWGPRIMQGQWSM